MILRVSGLVKFKFRNNLYWVVIIKFWSFKKRFKDPGSDVTICQLRENLFME